MATVNVKDIKIYLDYGHGGNDNGAVKYLTEDTMNLVQGRACAADLRSIGFQVKESRTTDEYKSLADRVKEANDWDADVFISFHNNGGGGDGFEFIYSIFQDYTKGKDLRLGQLIEAEIKAIGQNSRGAKQRKDSSTGRDYFGFIRELVCPSIIVEGCFVDSNDRFIADTEAEQKAFGVAYAKGILKYFGIPYKPVQAPVASNTGTTMYRVVTGSFKDKANAEKRVRELKAKGFDSFIEAKK